MGRLGKGRTVRRLVEKADCFVGYDREYSVTEYIRDLGKIFRNVSGEECWGRFLIWCYTDCLMEYIQTERNRYPEVVALMEEQLKVMYRKTTMKRMFLESVEKKCEFNMEIT